VEQFGRGETRRCVREGNGRQITLIILCDVGAAFGTCD